MSRDILRRPGTRVYMRVEREGKVISYILDNVEGEIESRHGVIGSRVQACFSGTGGLFRISDLSSGTQKRRILNINKVYFNPPYTVVIWEDSTKTKIKCQDGDIYDPEKGLALAISKKALGNKGSWYETFKKFISPVDLKPEPAPAEKLKYKIGDKVLIKQTIENYDDLRRCSQTVFDSLKGKKVVVRFIDSKDPILPYYMGEGQWISEDWIEKKVEE